MNARRKVLVWLIACLALFLTACKEKPLVVDTARFGTLTAPAATNYVFLKDAYTVLEDSGRKSYWWKVEDDGVSKDCIIDQGNEEWTQGLYIQYHYWRFSTTPIRDVNVEGLCVIIDGGY